MEMAQITALIGAAASLLCTLVVGALTYFVKQTLNDFRKADERNAQKLAEVDKRHAANYKELTQQISDLKSDLPLVYVLREDFIRSMNNVDGKLDIPSRPPRRCSPSRHCPGAMWLSRARASWAPRHTSTG